MFCALGIASLHCVAFIRMGKFGNEYRTGQGKNWELENFPRESKEMSESLLSLSLSC